jgi:L-rhamnose isomerase
MREETKSQPVGAVWDYYCLSKDIPYRDLWVQDIARYEAEVLRKRAE